MNVYPQLNSGALVQFPFRASYRRRTILNELVDGQSIRLEDWGAQQLRWRIEYVDLSVAEWHSLRDLHVEMEGRLGTFSFFDPNANLLAWSEEIERSVWLKDPFLAVSGGVGDPEGGTNARMLSNSGPSEQQVVQRVAIPESYDAALSVWLRSSADVTVDLIRQSRRTAVHVGARWRRVQCCGHGLGSSMEATFGVSIPPGATIEVFGMQVEAQPNPSSYKRTESQTGVYPKTRFSSDKIEVWADGPGRFRSVIMLESAAEVA